MLVKHKLDTRDAKLIRQITRRLPQVKREEAEIIVRQMEEERVIEPSSSPWDSLVVLVKTDRRTRLCVDYRQLNRLAKKDNHLLSRIDNTFDGLAETTLFSALDLKSGYWQVELDPMGSEQTTFTLRTGVLQFTVKMKKDVISGGLTIVRKHKLKRHLTSAPVLSYPLADGCFILD